MLAARCLISLTMSVLVAEWQPSPDERVQEQFERFYLAYALDPGTVPPSRLELETGSIKSRQERHGTGDFGAQAPRH